MQETKRSKAKTTAKRPNLRRKNLPTEEKVKASKKQKTLDNRLLVAIRLSKTSEVERLLRKGASANAKDKAEDTALMFAAGGGNTDICSLLINGGAEVDATDNTGKTALMSAAFTGRTKTCASLILKGADVWANDSKVRTASSIAESRFEFDTEKFLKAVESFSEFMGEDSFRAFTSDLKECVSSP